MFRRDKDKLALSKLLMFGSLVGVFFAVMGALGSDVYLASTQWLLVAAVLAVWAIYSLIEAQFQIKK